MWNAWEIVDVRTGFWWGDLREGNHLGRPTHRQEDNIKMDLEGAVDMDWVDLSQYRARWLALGNVVMKTSGYVKCGEFLH